MVKGNKEHTLGPPFVHILLASLPELAKNAKVGAKHQRKITEYMEFAEKANLETMCDHIKLFRISKTYRSDTVKVQFAFTEKISIYKEEEVGATPMEEVFPEMREVQASIIMAMKS
eukprot:14096375-Heterocapsa_arctica.AAC.1